MLADDILDIIRLNVPFECLHAETGHGLGVPPTDHLPVILPTAQLHGLFQVFYADLFLAQGDVALARAQAGSGSQRKLSLACKYVYRVITTDLLSVRISVSVKNIVKQFLRFATVSLARTRFSSKVVSDRCCSVAMTHPDVGFGHVTRVNFATTFATVPTASPSSDPQRGLDSRRCNFSLHTALTAVSCSTMIIVGENFY